MSRGWFALIVVEATELMVVVSNSCGYIELVHPFVLLFSVFICLRRGVYRTCLRSMHSGVTMAFVLI